MTAASAPRIGVIGAGIVGLSVARRLAELWPDAQITVVDKEDDVAVHQTGHNSGVVHAGLYYEPGSLKARLCTRGRGLLEDFCGEHALQYDECGKLVVARDEDEVPALRDEDVVRAPAGVRAQAIDRDGTLVDDFRVHRLGPVVTVRNAPSPAATSALAIGEYVAERVLEPE